MTSTQKNMLQYITIRLMWKTDLREWSLFMGRGGGKWEGGGQTKFYPYK
jgi:hypothetical protein